MKNSKGIIPELTNICCQKWTFKKYLNQYSDIGLNKLNDILITILKLRLPFISVLILVIKEKKHEIKTISTVLSR